MKYKIKSGDTLSQIAKDNNISLKKLAELNNIKDANKIFAGKTLDIPSREKPKTKKSSSVERVNQSDPFFIQEESGAFKSTAPKSTTKVTPAVQEKKIATDKNNEFYSGNLPLAVRQLADDTKYDIFRNFLPKTTADKLSKKLFGEEENITKSDFSKEEFEVLRNIVKQNVLQDKFSVDYDDYRNFGAKGSSTIKDNPFELLNNPARSLQYTFGKGNINVDDKGDVYFTDQFNFNDAKMAENPQAYYGSAWDDEGFLKMDYDSGLRGLLSNQFKKVRNYKTRVGRGEGEGAATNLLIGNIKDFQNPINEIYASRKTGGITNYNKGGQMDIQQQTKNVAAQGRYGDSMLLHVNPAEVKGLSSAMPITVNPQTGQPEAFLPFLAPLLGSMGFSALAGTGLGATLGLGGLSAGALSGIGAGLAQTAVTGDIKEGLKAGLTAGLSTRILTGAGNTQIGQDALTTPTTSLPTDPTTGLNYSPTGALESAMTQNIATTNPALANPIQAGATVTGTPLPPTLNPIGQANLNTFMSGPAADNYLQPFADDAIANFGAKAGNPTALESLGASFTDSTGGYDIGQGFSNIGSAAMNDPLALAGLGTTGSMYGMDMMQADYEEQVARMQAEREEKKRQNELMNPEPILYSAGGGIQKFDEGGLVDNLLSGDYGMLGMLNNNPELMFGATGLAAKNNFRGSLLGELYNQYRKRKDAGDEVGAAALQSEIQSEESMQMAAGGSIRGFNGQDGSNTSGELPQIFAPARAAYDVNPNFMAGFNPETMYFNPSTIAAPASGLEAGGPPIVLDTYTGTKGGYGGDPLVISPEGRQASIDPFSAYTGEAPAGLVPYSTTQPAPYIDITGEDLGITDGTEGVYDPTVDGITKEEPIIDESFDPNNYTIPDNIQDLIDSLDLSNINFMGSNIDLTGFNPLDYTVDPKFEVNDPTNMDDLINLDNNLMTDSLDTNINNNLNDTFDIDALSNLDNINAGIDSFTTTDNTLNNTLDLSAFDPYNQLDTTTNLDVTDTLSANTLAGFNPTDTLDTTSNLGELVSMPSQNLGMTDTLDAFNSLNTFGLTEDQLNRSKMDSLTMAEGGQLPNKGLEALNKVAPNVVDKMGYQEGGMTMMNDPLTQEVTAFLLGESNNEEALNMFLTKYGNEAFMQLREAVLQSVVPGAQTQGQIKGNGEGGMDDDLKGMIGDKERIAVSQDEFIVPADVVSMLGDGSSDAGSKELYEMMDRVRQEKTGTTKQAPRLANAGGMLPA
jgi:hypothetical protein